MNDGSKDLGSDFYCVSVISDDGVVGWSAECNHQISVNEVELELVGHAKDGWLIRQSRFRWEGEQFLSSTGMAFGLERNAFHKRASLFHSLEEPALAPLSAERFDMSQWSRATVNIDYHIAFNGNFYSVPNTLVQQVVEVRSTPTTVEIFH
jgi:hypothetical protein